MVNSVVLVGRLTADPDMRYIQSGAAVATFRLAVNRPPRRSQDGSPATEQTDFIDIVTWRSQAEFVGNYMKKGALVAVEGRIQTRSFETQDGQRRRAVEVVAFRVQALESRAERERREAAEGAAPAAPTGPPPQVAPAAPQAPAAPATAPPTPSPAPQPPPEPVRPPDAVGGALPTVYEPSQEEAVDNEIGPPIDDDDPFADQ